MSTQSYTVQQGDHLPQIALKFGVAANDIWSDARQDPLRDAGRTPYLLYPGDVLTFEAPEKRTFAVQTGKAYTFVAKVPPMKVSVTFTGSELANAACTIRFGKRSLDATTDGSGKLSFSAPVNVQIFEVEFKDLGYVQQLKVGHLDPVSEQSGQVQRLQNLGYLPRGDADQTMALGRALARYQMDNNLPVSADADDATLAHLEDTHGC